MAPFHRRRTVFLNESTTWTRALASTGIMMHDLKPVEPDLTEYEACASSGPPNNLERFRAARRRGVPEITFRVDTKVQEVYETANAAAFAVLTEYAKQVEGLTEHAKDLVSRPAVGLPRVVISTAASMTAAQIDATIHCVVPSRHNAVAKVLALRNSHGAGLLPTESYDVVHPNVFKTTGTLTARVLRNALSVGTSFEHTKINEVHDKVSNGWFGGCEADQSNNLPMLTGILRTEKGAAAARMQSKFKVTDLTARGESGVDGQGRPVFSYTNADGEDNSRGACAARARHMHDHPSPSHSPAMHQPLSCPTLCTRSGHVHRQAQVPGRRCDSLEGHAPCADPDRDLLS